MKSLKAALKNLWNPETDRALILAAGAAEQREAQDEDEVFVPLAQFDPEEGGQEAQSEMEASMGINMLAACLMGGPAHLIGEALHVLDFAQEMSDATVRQIAPGRMQAAERAYRQNPTPTPNGSRRGVYVRVPKAPQPGAIDAREAWRILAARRQAREAAAMPTHTPPAVATSHTPSVRHAVFPVLVPNWARSLNRPWAS